MKRINSHVLFALLAILCSLFLCACSGEEAPATSPSVSIDTTQEPTTLPQETETVETTIPMTVEEDFLSSLSSVLMERWDVNSSAQYDTLREDIANRKKCINTELKKLEPFTEKTFEDDTLGDLAQQYITLLYASKASLDYYEDEVIFSYIWDEIYYQRCLLLTQFVDEYGLTVDSEYTSILDDITTDGMFATEELEDIHLLIGEYCYEQMTYSIEVIDDGLLSVKVGTPEFKKAVQYVVPDYAYENAENGDEKITLIHDYLDGHKYLSRYFTVSSNGDITIELVNIIEFVHDCQEIGIFYGEDESSFGLEEDVESIYTFSEKLEVTECVVIAMLYAIDSVSYNWSDSIVLEVLDLPAYTDFIS